MGKGHRNRQEPVNSNTGFPGFVTVAGHHSKSASLPSRTSFSASQGSASKPTLTQIFSKESGDADSTVTQLGLGNPSENGDSERGGSRASTGDLSQDDLSERGNLDRSSMSKSQRRRINRHASQKSKSTDSSDGHPSPTSMDQSSPNVDTARVASVKPVIEEPKEPSSVSEPTSPESLSSKQASGTKPPPAGGRNSPLLKKKAKFKVEKETEGEDAELSAKSPTVQVAVETKPTASRKVEAAVGSTHGPTLAAKVESFYPVQIETVKVFQPDPEAEELRVKVARTESALKEKSVALTEMQEIAAVLKREMASLKQHEQDIASSFAVQQQENRDLKSRNDTLVRSFQEMQEKKAEKDAVLQDVLARVSDLEQRIVSEEEEKETLKLKLHHVTQERQDLKHNLRDQCDQLKKLEEVTKENEGLRQQTSDLRQETSRLHLHTVEFEKLVKTGDGSLERVDVVQKRLEEAEKRLKDLDGPQHVAELAKVREELEATQKKTVESDAEIERMKLELARTAENLRIREEELAAEAEELTQKNTFLNQQLKAVSDSSMRNEELKEKLQKESGLLKTQTDDLHRQLDMATVRLHKMDELERNNLQLETQVQALLDEMAKADQLREMIRSHDENSQALALELANLAEANKRAETSLYEQNERVMEQQVALESAQERVRFLEQEIATKTSKEFDRNRTFLVHGAKDTRETAAGSAGPESFHIESQTDHTFPSVQTDKSQQHQVVAHHIIGVEASPSFIREERHAFAAKDENPFGMPDFAKPSSLPNDEDASSASDVKEDRNRTVAEPRADAPLIDPGLQNQTVVVPAATNGNAQTNGHRASVGAASDKSGEKSTGRKLTDHGSSSFSVAGAVLSAKEASEKSRMTDQRDSSTTLPKDILIKDSPSSFLNPTSSVKLAVSCGASFGLGVVAAYVLARSK